LTKSPRLSDRHCLLNELSACGFFYCLPTTRITRYSVGGKTKSEATCPSPTPLTPHRHPDLAIRTPRCGASCVATSPARSHSITVGVVAKHFYGLFTMQSTAAEYRCKSHRMAKVRCTSPNTQHPRLECNDVCVSKYTTSHRHSPRLFFLLFSSWWLRSCTYYRLWLT
jgi:hypothetical protein